MRTPHVDDSDPSAPCQADSPRTVRLTPFLFLLLFCLDVTAQIAGERARFARDRFYLEGSTASVLYQGDRPWSGESGLAGLINRTGPGGELKLGYRLGTSSDLAVGWMAGIYPGILSPGADLELIDATSSSKTRSSVLLEYRYRMLPFGSYEPFFALGWGSVYSRVNSLDQWGGGPSLSIGVYRPFGKIDVGVQLRQQYVMPDQAVDRAVSGSGADVLHAVLIGVRYALPVRSPALNEVSLASPGFLDTSEEGVFMVESDLDPAELSVRWDMGDGQTALGQSIRHAFREAGTFTVSAHISSSKESIRLETRVSVRERVERAAISSITHTPMSGLPGDTIRFIPNLRGTDVDCLWAFGDGASSSTCETKHVFSDPGTYRVLLSASNAGGNDAMSRTIRIAPDACAGLDRLTDVHFRRNSRELVLDMRELLRKNFADAARCPDRLLIVSGFAFDSERDAQELALARAEAVLQYYLNLGMSTRTARLGRAVVQSEEGWIGDLWQGRKTTTALIRE